MRGYKWPRMEAGEIGLCTLLSRQTGGRTKIPLFWTLTASQCAFSVGKVLQTVKMLTGTPWILTRNRAAHPAVLLMYSLPANRRFTIKFTSHAFDRALHQMFVLLLSACKHSKILERFNRHTTPMVRRRESNPYQKHHHFPSIQLPCMVRPLSIRDQTLRAFLPSLTSNGIPRVAVRCVFA